MNSRLKIFLTSILFATFLTLIFTIATATAKSRPNEIESFRVHDLSVAGIECARIEIEFDKDKLDFKYEIDPESPTDLLLNFDETIPGSLHHETNLRNFAGGFTQKVTASEVEKYQTQLRITFSEDLTTHSYRVYTLPKNKKEGKKFRVVIDAAKFAGEFELAPPEPSEIYLAGSRTIVIDPGHGGSDNGAIGFSGTREKDITLAVALKTRKILQDLGEKVIMTRDADTEVALPTSTAGEELQARVDTAYLDPNSKIFVSIHCNAFVNPKSNGTESFFHENAESQRLAAIINEELISAGGLRNRGVKSANFYVLTHSQIPATLLELAFLTNPDEEELLTDEKFQDEIARAIARGIQKFFGSDLN